ncbi:MAG TPA: MarR family transcriptional regulator [Candidatus Saccharimonadales bacterium]|jgi:DNA-binding MarR family transcriptional regulator
MSITAEQVCDDLIELLDFVKHRMLELAEYQGLTRMQIFGLYILDRYPDIGMSHMAEVLHCDASNVTGIIERLVQQDLVSRHEDEKDRRIKKITVTKKGKLVINKVMANLPKILGCDKLSAAERISLHSAIQKLGV